MPEINFVDTGSNTCSNSLTSTHVRMQSTSTADPLKADI